MKRRYSERERESTENRKNIHSLLGAGGLLSLSVSGGGGGSCPHALQLYLSISFSSRPVTPPFFDALNILNHQFSQGFSFSQHYISSPSFHSSAFSTYYLNFHAFSSFQQLQLHSTTDFRSEISSPEKHSPPCLFFFFRFDSLLVSWEQLLSTLSS